MAKALFQFVVTALVVAYQRIQSSGTRLLRRGLSMLRVLFALIMMIPMFGRYTLNTLAQNEDDTRPFRSMIVEWLGTPTPDGYWTAVNLVSQPTQKGYEYGYISGISVPDGYEFETDDEAPFSIYHDRIDTLSIAKSKKDPAYVAFRWDRQACPPLTEENVLLNWSQVEQTYSLAMFNGTAQKLWFDTNQSGEWREVPSRQPIYTEITTNGPGVITVRTEPNRDRGKFCGTVVWYPSNMTQ